MAITLVEMGWDVQSEYERDGYFVVKNFVDVDPIRSDIFSVFSPFLGEPTEKEIFRLFHSDFDAYLGCTKMCHQLPSVHGLGVSPKLLDIVRRQASVKVPVINTRPVLLFSAKGLAKHHFYWRAKPHQDLAITNGSKDSVVVWIPLCDMSFDLGYLEVVAGSHKKELLEHKKNGPSLEIVSELMDEDFIPVPMNKGDALFFSAGLIHRSGINSTNDLIRLTVSYRFDNMIEPAFVARKYPSSFDYVMKQ